MSEVLQAHITVALVPADREYFICGKQVHYGTIFFLKKAEWDHYEGPYALNADHVYSGDLALWLQAKMVYRKAAPEQQPSWGQWLPVL